MTPPSISLSFYKIDLKYDKIYSNQGCLHNLLEMQYTGCEKFTPTQAFTHLTQLFDHLRMLLLFFSHSLLISCDKNKKNLSHACLFIII